jgi:hypothetical protein
MHHIFSFVFIAVVSASCLAGCSTAPKEDYFSPENMARRNKEDIARQLSYETNTFKPRPYPEKIIAIEVAYRVNDPNNSFIKHLLARHNGPDPSDYDFCGEVFHGNMYGYIDNSTTFYGTYTSDAKITAFGKAATKLCHERVLNEPNTSKPKTGT